MSVQGDGDLHVYVLSVGQADASVVVTPGGAVLVIDAVSPTKLKRLLDDLGLDGTIEELIITHPHNDHYRGANRLLKDYHVESVTMAPLWNDHGLVSPSYAALLNRIEDEGCPVRFVAGYDRIYPDGALNQNQGVNVDATYLELLGPPNRLTDELADANVLDVNHLSIMARVHFQDFSMVLAADAQMENWSIYDAEGMLRERCDVLKTAHHGSANGTQWERLNRLSPRYVLISSDPDTHHHLPDLIGAAVFAKYEVDGNASSIVCMTSDTGTVRLTARHNGGYDAWQFEEERDERVPLGQGSDLTRASNPTDWQALLTHRVDAFYSL